MHTAATPSAALDHPMSPALTDTVKNRYDRSFLRRLFSFASSLDGEPCEIDEALVADFADAVVAAGIDRPKQVVRDAVQTWNRMVETVDGWPQNQLPLTDSRGWRATAMEETCPSPSLRTVRPS
jgi:hypothetical protein